ncbi:hypothetical protein GCM10025771_32960 [Niveibacterium umoris]
MLCQTEVGIAFVQGFHLCVTNCLRKDRRCGDFFDLGVASDHRAHCAIEVRAPVAIYPHFGWRDAKRLHRTFHRKHCGTENIELIDLGRRGFRHTPSQCALSYLQGERNTLLRGERFRIVQARYRALRIKDDGRRDDCATQRPTPGFIDTSEQSHGAL